MKEKIKNILIDYGYGDDVNTVEIDKNDLDTIAEKIESLTKKITPSETTNTSGIIKIEIQKGDKLVTASMYLENYLKIKNLHQISLGDDMIDSLINELKD